MSVYFDSDDFKTSLAINDDFADDDIDLQLETASRDIDDATGQFFYQTDSETRTFYAPTWAPDIRIGPLTTLTTFAVDEDADGTFGTTWTVDEDFLLEPWNAALESKPYTHASIIVASGKTFPDVRPNVRVTGIFGWETVPAAIKTATQILTSRYLKRAREAPFAIIPGETMAARIARNDPDVYNLLLPYMRKAAVRSIPLS